MEFDARIPARSNISRADLDERHVRVEDREGVVHPGGRVIVVERHVQREIDLRNEDRGRREPDVAPGSTPTDTDNFALGTADAVGGATDASARDAGRTERATRSAVTRSP